MIVRDEVISGVRVVDSRYGELREIAAKVGDDLAAVATRQTGMRVWFVHLATGGSRPDLKTRCRAVAVSFMVAAANKGRRA